MDALYTPKNKKGFIDETLLTTPKPQASSTIERKGMSYSRKPKEKFDLDFIPVQEHENEDKSRSSSRLSSQSSLGIFSLDHVDKFEEFSLEPKVSNEFKDSKIKMPQPSDSITEKLLLQRKLAQKVLNRANQSTEKTVGGLPSYLLKPSDTPGRNATNNTTGIKKDDSTVNLSDLEEMCKNDNGKITFEVKDFSARSSSLGNESNQVVDLTTPSPNRSLCSDDGSEYITKSQAIYEKLRQSDIQLQQMYNRTESIEPMKTFDLPPIETIDISDESNNSWNMDVQDSLLQKLQNELFTPAELATEKFAADELEWRKEQDTIPLENPKNNSNRLELSCFSGYIGDSDMSSSSKLDEKMSIGQFFKRRSEHVEDLDLKASPEKKHIPVPLINVTEISESPRSTAPKMIDEPLQDASRISLESTISLSQITEALANVNVNDSPRKMVKYLMNHKKKNNTGPNNKNTSNCSTPKTYKIDSIMDSKENKDKPTKNTNTLFYSPLEFRDSILAEISNKQPRNSIAKNIPSTTTKSKENNVPIKNKTPRKSIRESLNAQEVITISDDTSVDTNEWKDANVNHYATPEAEKTVSNITESPSISCSELEFSEDEPETSLEIQNTSDEWIRIKHDNEPHRACVMVAYDTDVYISSLSTRWLLYKVSLGQVKVQGDVYSLSDNAIKMKLPDKEELLKQDTEQSFSVQFVTYICGKIELTLIVQLTDMVTKNQKEVLHTLIIESEEADITVSKDIINFDVLPEESRKNLDLTIINCSKVELPVILAILQENNIFTFGTDQSLDSSNPDFVVRSKLVLTSEAKVTIPIEMFAPSLIQLQCSSHVAELTGKLVIYLQTETSKVLKEVQLTGRIGMTKIQFRNSCLPMILTPGQTKTLQMKNSGLVQMELQAIIVETKNKTQDNIFTIDTPLVILKPNQSGQVNITFNPIGKFSGSVYRVLRMQHPGGPTFVCPLEGTSNDNSPKLSITPTRRSPRTSLSGKNSPRASLSGKNSPRTSLSGRNSPRDQCKSASPNQKSGRSSTDSGTISYLPNGKLPIETNKTELVWGCIKPGKSQTQEFIIRNRSLQRLRFHTSLSSTEFKFVKEQNEHVTSMSMVLHGMESRTMVINFSPNSVGAASAKLIFSVIDSNEISQLKPQMIFLYGYGGHSTVEVQGVAKDPSGKMWLSFGKFDYRTVLDQSFILKNTGSLAAFVHLTLCSKALYPFMNSSLKIVPNESIIPPNKEIEICVKFTPRQEDLKFFRNSGTNDVFEVALLQLVTGPEPTRGRIRKLFSKINQTGSCSFSPDLLSKLCVPFAGEHMPTDLASCKEKEVSSSLKQLLQGLTTREVMLTFEQDPEQSIALGNAVDDTCMFQSLCNDTAHLTLDHSQFDNPIRRTSGGFCTIEPMKLMLTPPVKTMDTVLLCSKHSRPMPFEITLPSNELQVEPSVGMVPPGQTTVITVSCASKHAKQLQFFKVMVYVENEVMEIEVKVVQVLQRRSVTPRQK